MNYPSSFFYFQATSAITYSASPSQRYDVIRLIQGHPKPWINLETAEKLQKKKLILSFWPNHWWYSLHQQDIQGMLHQLIADGFELFLWQYGKCFPFGPDQVKELDIIQVFEASFSPFHEEIIEAFCSRYHASMDQILIIDNYWMNALIHPQIDTPARTLNLSHLSLLDPHQIEQVICLQQTLEPPLSCIYADIFSNERDEDSIIPGLPFYETPNDYDIDTLKRLIRQYAPKIPIINHWAFLDINAEKFEDHGLVKEISRVDDKEALQDFSTITNLDIHNLKPGQELFLAKFSSVVILKIIDLTLPIKDFPVMPQVTQLKIMRSHDFDLETLLQKFPRISKLTLILACDFNQELIPHTWSLPAGHSLKYFDLRLANIHKAHINAISFELNQMLEVTTELETLWVDNLVIWGVKESFREEFLVNCPKLQAICAASSTARENLTRFHPPVYPQLKVFTHLTQQPLINF